MMDYLKVNGHPIPYSNGFTMDQVPNIINEVTLMDGSTEADINGWKYDDTSLEWGTLYEEDLITLFTETDPIRGTFNLSFHEPGSDDYKTVKAMRIGRGLKKTRYKEDGKIVWTGVRIDLTFPESYGG